MLAVSSLEWLFKGCLMKSLLYLEVKCGCYFQGLYYQVPSQDLEKGLVRVSDDRSISYMFDVEETFGRLNIYLDHLDMDLSEYISQAITYDMDACVSKTIGPPKKRYCNDFSLDEMVDWAEMEVNATDGVEARTSTTEVDATDGVDATDKGKEKVSQDATDVVQTRRSTVKINSETEYDSDDDSDYQSDKSVDYLSPGEEDLIEIRNRMKANREAKAKAKDNPVFGMNEPNNENSMPADNVRGETFEEHDIYMNQLLKSLNTVDKDRIVDDPFISVEKHVERYLMYDETTHWRLKKPKVGEKSGEVRVVAKYGQRPPKLSALEKVGEHYAMLRSYGKAILDSNLRSTVKLGVTVNPDGKTYFDRFYVCFAGLADRWKAGCRKIIDLDGCFLKSPNQGEILTAIGRDGNNHIYLVAWTVGLIEAVKDVMPNAEHRQCSRHIYENFRKQYPGLKFTQLFWAVFKASYPQLFNKVMDKIKSANPNAHKYLVDKNPKSWSRAFFEVDRGCEAIENGFSECFNSVIVNVRHKPLLTMLEAIRVIVLERMNKIREISRKWNHGVCPNIKKRLEWLKEQQRFWHVIPAGGNLFEVRSGSEGFTIDEGKRTYMYFVTYHNYLKPIPSMNFWPDQSMYSTVLPPKPRKMPGRLRKKRIRSVGEVVVQLESLRPRNKQSVDDLEDVDVVQRGTVRDEGAGGSRGGARGSRGRGGAVRSRGGAIGSRGGASVSGSRGGASVSRLRGVVGGSKRGSSVSCDDRGSTGRGAGGSGGASGSRGRGASGSGGASRSRGRGASGSRCKGDGG
ncbi:hypothetical protein Tco_1507773 [Tanacetum coccineum]